MHKNKDSIYGNQEGLPTPIWSPTLALLPPRCYSFQIPNRDFTQLPSLFCLENGWLRIRLDSKVKTNNENWKPLWAEGRGLQALTARGSGLGPGPPTPHPLCAPAQVQPPPPQPQQRAHSRQLFFTFLISKKICFPFFKKNV